MPNDNGNKLNHYSGIRSIQPRTIVLASCLLCLIMSMVTARFNSQSSFTKTRQEFRYKTYGNIKSPVFSPDSSSIGFIESRVGKSIIGIWNLDRNQCLSVFASLKAVHQIEFSPNMNLIAASGNQTELWDFERKKIRQIYNDKNSSTQTAYFSQDGCSITTLSKKREMINWNLDGKKIKSLSRPDCVLYLLANTSGKYVMALKYNHINNSPVSRIEQIEIIKTDNLTQRNRYKTGIEKYITRYYTDGRAEVLTKKGIFMQDLITGNTLDKSTAFFGWTMISPHKDWAAKITTENTQKDRYSEMVLIADIDENGKVYDAILKRDIIDASMAISPDGRYIACAYRLPDKNSNMSEISVWRIE